MSAARVVSLYTQEVWSLSVCRGVSGLAGGAYGRTIYSNVQTANQNSGVKPHKLTSTYQHSGNKVKLNIICVKCNVMHNAHYVPVNQNNNRRKTQMKVWFDFMPFWKLVVTWDQQMVEMFCKEKPLCMHLVSLRGILVWQMTLNHSLGDQATVQ